MNQAESGNVYGVEDFFVHGFAGPISVLSVDEAQEALDQIIQEDQESQLQGNRRFKVHLFLSKVNRIVHHPRLVQAVRLALQSPHIALWSSDLNIKQPNSQQYYSEHQDSTYTGLSPADQCLTVWVALSDPVGVKEGCLSFVKESHKWGQLPHAEQGRSCSNVHNSSCTDDNHEENSESGTTASNNMLSRGQRVIPDPNRKMDWGEIPLRAGQATFHHFYTIHKSGFNHSNQPRVGLALRYMAVGVRQTGPVRECVTWIEPCENETKDGHHKSAQKRKELEQLFDLEPRLPDNPSEDDTKVGRIAHEEAMRREASNYFQESDTVKAYDEEFCKPCTTDIHCHCSSTDKDPLPLFFYGQRKRARHIICCY